jgi:hypothetical protein
MRLRFDSSIKLGGVTALFAMLLGGGPSFAADFNADGLDDLVVGAPGKALWDGPRSGAAFSFQGSAGGLLPDMVLDQEGLGANEADDQLGAAIATGDFDGDGFDDVALGAPGEAPGESPASGAVFVFKGGETGLRPDIALDQSGLGYNEEGDRFGASLVAGDFDGDGFDDLAVGAPGEAPGDSPRSGAVFVFLGSASGLMRHTSLDQAQAGLGANESGDRFGEALSAGDFDGDGHSDLAVGAPGEAPGASPKSGVVFVFKGATTGLTPGRVIDQMGLGGNEEGDRFGAALSSADFDGDGFADLAVGAPGESPGKSPRSGAVFVFHGTIIGLLPDRVVTEAGLGANEAGDRFGAALASGDFDGDGVSDLAIGAPGEAPGSGPRSGAVVLFRGGAKGLSGSRFLDQSGLGTNELGDRFGAALGG